MPKRGKFEPVVGGVEVLSEGRLPDEWLVMGQLIAKVAMCDVVGMAERFVRYYVEGKGRDERRDGIMGWSECCTSGWCRRQRRAA